MFEIIINSSKTADYYNITFVSDDESHYINVYISLFDNSISINISRSEDGFYFKSPCSESNDINISSFTSIENAVLSIRNHFESKGYKILLNK
jgi:hypothetical protein